MTTPGAPALRSPDRFGHRGGSVPTVLLVHGAFADTSSWVDVMDRLGTAATDVVAVANPLRGLSADAAYLAAVARQIDGPVLLVGHAYAGAVITVSGTQAGNVVGLVYVAGFALDTAESCVDLASRFPVPSATRALRPAFYPLDGRAGVELLVERSAFHDVYAGNLSPAAARDAARTQRPVAARALEERAGDVAWRTVPSWYLVTLEDRMVHPDAQRFMAQRAGARTTEVAAAHSVLRSHPEQVAACIRSAATSDRTHP